MKIYKEQSLCVKLKIQKRSNCQTGFGSDASAVVNVAVMWLKQSVLSLLTPIICQSTLYLEEIPESALPAQNIAAGVYTKSEFEFEEERLAEAFSKLPLMRKRILTMLFVENIGPDEISKNLYCSPQYVYNQRYKALKALRNELDKDGEQS